MTNQYRASVFKMGRFGRTLHSANSEKSIKDFWLRVNKSGPVQSHVPEIGNCWEWDGMISDRGYPKFWNGETTVRASRFSYLINCGEIPSGLVVCHKCDNTKCVRPNHLFLGTHRENILDASKKKRLRGMNRTHCKNGHEFNIENTIWYGTIRKCRACCRNNSRKYQLSHSKKLK